MGLVTCDYCEKHLQEDDAEVTESGEMGVFVRASQAGRCGRIDAPVL